MPDMPNKVRELRVAKGRGWTQEQLAQKAHVTVGTISRIERGERNPSPLIAWRITKALLGGDAKIEEVFPGLVIDWAGAGV